MQLIWFRFVQFYITIGLKFYYKKIDVTFLEEIPKDKAVIFLSNHQNALLDPLLISIKSARENYFLTRAAVFKNPIIAKTLNSLQMLPIYRVIDRVDIFQKNKETFALCSKLLHKKKSIILFPEGNHDLKRRVRPLKKGYARIIEETLQKYPNTEIAIIPIGVNYQAPMLYGDTMSVYFGNHISPNDYWNGSTLDFLALSKAVTLALKKLTTDIESLADYPEILSKLEQLNVDFTDPIAVNECLSNGFNYHGTKVTKNSKAYFIVNFMVKLFYFIPYLIWKKVASPKVKEDEFIATFLYASIITLAPIYLTILVVTATILFGNSTGVTVLLVGVLLPLLALRVK